MHEPAALLVPGAGLGFRLSPRADLMKLPTGMVLDGYAFLLHCLQHPGRWQARGSGVQKVVLKTCQTMWC